MKHDINPRTQFCRVCKLSAEAIVSLPILPECPGRELVTDERGFPVPMGSTEAIDLNDPGDDLDPLEQAAEEERRRDHGDPPLEPNPDLPR